MAATGALGLALAAPAVLVHAEPAIPSESEVRSAEEKANAKQNEVATIQSQLDSAAAELEDLQIASARAHDAYNGAQEKLAVAQRAEQGKQRVLKKAEAKVAASREDVGELARSEIQGKGPLVEAGSLLTSNGPEEMLERAARFTSVSTVLQGKQDQLVIDEAAAEQARTAAAEATAAVQAETEKAATAKNAAEAASQRQQAAVDGYSSHRATLIKELAEAQRVSVAVATERREGIEAQRRATAEAKARKAEQAQQAREEKAAEERAVAQRATRAERERRQAQQADQDRAAASSKDNADAPAAPAPKPEPKPDPKPKPKPDPKPKPKPKPKPDPEPEYNGSGAQAAISFARAQIGEPYVWGAAGPNSWDCSGLTMKAWAAGGKSIGHYTGTQWSRIQHISQSQLQPGDLVFWASNASDASSIHHVGLYIGGGQMIHAPKPGQDVEQQSIYYWYPPTHFGRP
ncbi:MAG: NlpC/P60 family protein [Propionibacteriaceae bacterium]